MLQRKYRETIEIDYKSLHPVLAYAKKGIDFWKGVNVTKYSYFNDAYDVPTTGLKDKEDSRAVVKLLFLTALNAKNEKECFESFRDEWDYEGHPYTFGPRHFLTKHKHVYNYLKTNLLQIYSHIHSNDHHMNENKEVSHQNSQSPSNQLS